MIVILIYVVWIICLYIDLERIIIKVGSIMYVWFQFLDMMKLIHKIDFNMFEFFK